MNDYFIPFAVIGILLVGLLSVVGGLAILTRLIAPTDHAAIRKQCILAEKLTPGCEILLKQEKKP